jgi:antitoxin MazE
MEATAKISSWGGSVGIRIPKNILNQIGLTEKATVSIRVTEDNELLVAPVRERKTLAQLFEEYPADYIHDKELDWGKPMGGEVW